jgi:hypothetical protein
MALRSLVAGAAPAAPLPWSRGSGITVVGHGTSITSTVSAAARGGLSERGLIVRDDPDLSALVGARSGTADDTLGTRGNLAEVEL